MECGLNQTYDGCCQLSPGSGRGGVYLCTYLKISKIIIQKQNRPTVCYSAVDLQPP